jgi:Fe-S-cluster containining protein
MMRELVQRWLRAALDPVVRGELESVYADIAAQVEARGPVCWASGRCCHFEKAGHLLYVTGLEAAYAVVGRGEAVARGGVRGGSDFPLRPRRASATSPAGGGGGGCVYQSGNLCTAHAVKPLGCRVYFCDRSAEEWQYRLSEHGLAQVRGIHDRHGLEYRYGEWRAMLAAVMAGWEGGGAG